MNTRQKRIKWPKGYLDSVRTSSTQRLFLIKSILPFLLIVVLSHLKVSGQCPTSVSAGPNQFFCCGNQITLAGVGSTSIKWTPSIGTFSPNNTTLNAQYTPSPIECTLPVMALFLEDTTIGCPKLVDTIFLFPAILPYVNAGPDIQLCTGSFATLNATAYYATTKTWTTSGTGSFGNASSATTSYTPSMADVALGSVTLTLTCSSACGPSSDELTITFYTPTPTVNAGPDQPICCGGTATLSGTVTGATSAKWTGGAGVYTPDNTTLNATYKPTAIECAAGSVVLTLGLTSICPSLTDQVVITMTPIPIVHAGVDQSICTTASSTPIAASVYVATGGVWSTSGTGSFGDISSLSTTYSPSVSDISSGTLVLSITTIGNGACNASTDDMNLNFTTCTGLLSESGLQEVKIYPSPANKLVSVEVPAGTMLKEVSVMNSLQNTIPLNLTEKEDHKATLDITNLSSGIYFVKIVYGSSVGIQKLVVE